ncbi:hypothetical protein CC80DRAFT_5613 [Byssothecium circinans]|uniref:Uncharacterized protein n=1 Tax=Byssothecium circinans TaxID=147558 RepID=A0A6A5UFD6_9PLEO|nr:hypothetical protein CC80DRAFT_5613 [Byssothecium circinans]
MQSSGNGKSHLQTLKLITAPSEASRENPDPYLSSLHSFELLAPTSLKRQTLESRVSDAHGSGQLRSESDASCSNDNVNFSPNSIILSLPVSWLCDGLFIGLFRDTLFLFHTARVVCIVLALSSVLCFV